MTNNDEEQLKSGDDLVIDMISLDSLPSDVTAVMVGGYKMEREGEGWRCTDAPE